MRTAIVIGTGLIGTSAALALAARGVEVYLEDHDPSATRTAVALRKLISGLGGGPTGGAMVTTCSSGACSGTASSYCGLPHL